MRARVLARTAPPRTIVPVAMKSAASFPKSLAACSSSFLVVGSKPCTSSSTSASTAAANISGVGMVTVSERRSISRALGIMVSVASPIRAAASASAKGESERQTPSE